MPNIARLFEFAALFGCHAAELLDQVSLRADDQARHLGRLLAALNETDRQWLVDMVEHLSARLRQSPVPPPGATRAWVQARPG